MNIKVLPALMIDKPVKRQMMELYQYDSSEFENTDLNEHGYFGYKYLDYYWSEPKRYPFIVRFEDKLAGFVLVNECTYFSDNQYSMAEFFILRKYRGRGIGRQVAFDVFDLFCGRWEVYQVDTNVVGQKFWRSTIGDYTKGNYIETIIENKSRSGIIQRFDNSEYSINT